MHRFPNFYTLKVEIFRMFFIRSRLLVTPMNRGNFHGNWSARFSKIRKTQTDRRGNFIYTDKVSFDFIFVNVFVVFVEQERDRTTSDKILSFVIGFPPDHTVLRDVSFL